MTTSAPISQLQWWYGRDEPPIVPRDLRAGPVTGRLVGRDLRNVRFGETEIAQRIYVAIRDRNWGTAPGEVTDLDVEEGERQFAVRFTVTHRQHDVDLVWRGEILGTSDGAISYAMDAVAGADMTYKLIGLNVHHGMHEYAGRPCHGVTPDGSISDRFSTEVAPQLIADATEVPIFPPVESLTVRLAGDILVRFDYEGDTFEFEDQRNWTDASFKSQSYPPRRGGFFTIRAGERVSQKVTLTPSGTPTAATDDDGPVRVELGDHIPFSPGSIGRVPAQRVAAVYPSGGGVRADRMPPIGLGMASHARELSAQEVRLLSALRLDHLRVDLRLADPEYPVELSRAIDAAAALGCGLELALHLMDDADAQLANIVGCLAERARIDRVLVFHEAEPATNPRWVDLARRRLREVAPDALFAGGTNANFCELNRFRPDGTGEDGIVYSINPQIHAFDELSLAENIAGQAETVKTALAYGGGRPVVVSPITLRPRFNSVATGAEPEPAADELPPQVDPRQMSLFAAAWTVGSLRSLVESGVAAATFYETTGWRGIIQGDEPPPVPELFPSRAGMVFPVYHVFADLAEWKDGHFISSRSSNLLAVETLAILGDGIVHVLVANLTPTPQTVVLDAISGEITLRRLNAETAEMASFDPAGFRCQTQRLSVDGARELVLAPFEVARLDGPGPTAR